MIDRACIPSLMRDAALTETEARLRCEAMTPNALPPNTRTPTPGQTAPPIDPRTIAEQAVLRLTLPRATPHIGPHPDLNRWGIAVVGHPYWFWTDPTDTIERTITQDGITLTLRAVRTTTTFTTGDGTTLSCPTTTAWTPQVPPGTESPTCGHRYTSPSPAGHPYTLQATDHWTVTWTALGQTGTLTLAPTESTTLTVAELHAVTR